jgi:hypothetical protein
LKITLSANFVRGTNPVGSANVTLGAKSTIGASIVHFTSQAPVQVPAGATGVGFHMSVGDGKTSADQDSQNNISVIPTDATHRHLLFDNDDRDKLRDRLIDGKAVLAGGTNTLTYSKIRQGIVSNESSIDTVIGTTTDENGKPLNVLGTLETEVTYGLGTGATFDPEKPLAPQASSPFFPSVEGPVVGYQADLDVPKGTTKIALFFHTKTFLKVHFPDGVTLVTKKFNEGDRILMREAFDNPNGPNTNYEFGAK